LLGANTFAYLRVSLKAILEKKLLTLLASIRQGMPRATIVAYLPRALVKFHDIWDLFHNLFYSSNKLSSIVSECLLHCQSLFSGLYKHANLLCYGIFLQP
jgi:hypothetical protein